MPPRDRLRELIDWKLRRAQGSAPLDQLRTLQNTWTRRGVEHRDVSDFFLMRAVTLIEVFSREWLAQLVDHGSPYLENAAQLGAATKLDFSTFRAVHGAQVTIGEVIAHSVSFNGIADLDKHFGAVIGQNFFALIALAHDRYLLQPATETTPIISDLQTLKAQLAQLFRVRHILTHELPRKPPYHAEDVAALLAVAVDFASASDQTFLELLYGDYPLTTIEMQSAAAEACGEADVALQAMYASVQEKVGEPALLQRNSEAFETYRHAQAELRSSILAGGSYQNISYAQELRRLTEEQTRRLAWFLEREEGEVF